MSKKLVCNRCQEEVKDWKSKCKCFPFWPLIRREEDDGDNE